VVDTHAHLALCEAPTRELTDAARQSGVRRILTVGLDEASNRDALAAAREHDEVFACVGRHPNSAAGFDDRAAAEIQKLTAEPRVVAIGETGLDYYRDGAPRAAQRAAFEAQIELARRALLPLVIHVRDGEGEGDDAVADVFSTLRESANGVTVVLHCYSAGPERVTEAAERGWYCSFAGNLTYPKAEELRAAARRVPDELLLVETDSPFLAPQAVRGRPNQPANVVETARRLAGERGLSYEELEGLVEANAARAFDW
jgi:TatD DNase family protein